MKNLKDLFDQCIGDLEAINIPIASNITYKVNTRAKARWGQCARKGNNYTIEIASVLLQDNVPHEATIQTIYHELLHTCPDCMNHGKIWKAYGQKVHDFYGIDITRATSSEAKGVELPKRTVNYHYKITCNKCNRNWKYQRESKVVVSCRKNNAKCPCGASDFLVVNL